MKLISKNTVIKFLAFTGFLLWRLMYAFVAFFAWSATIVMVGCIAWLVYTMWIIDPTLVVTGSCFIGGAFGVACFCLIILHMMDLARSRFGEKNTIPKQ